MNELLGDASHGTYVDIGAFDPWRFSNTAFFYHKGWRGLNVDARPGFKTLFDKERPRDLNIECAAGKGKNPVKLFLFDEPALNTTCAKRASFLEKNSSYRIKGQAQSSIRTLASLLDEYDAKSIDFLSIDVEGAELNVLRSGNWKKHRPKYVVLEVLDTPLQHLGKNPCVKFMKRNRYEVLTKGLRSVILKNKG